MTTLKDFAQLFNNSVYGDDVIFNNRKELDKNNFVAVCGYSDDTLELIGEYCDEIDCYNDTTIYYINRQFISNHKLEKAINDMADNCEALREPVESFIKSLTKYYIKIQNNVDGQMFKIETNIPCEWFNVLSDDDNNQIYCNGFVFNLKDFNE